MTSQEKSEEQAPTAAPSRDMAPTVIEPATGSDDKLIGTKIDGRYLVERELGRGGIGKVYLARDKPEMHSRPVVIKVLLEESLNNPWAVQKFHQEAEALIRLDDSGIVGILDTGTLPDGKPYLVMQYVEGDNLRTIMRPGEGVELERVAHIMKQVGRALTTAHDKGIFHRDLKPENIMIRTIKGEDHVKVIDFGIAKVKDSVVGPSTAAGMTAGTYAYMSPEQLFGQPVSAASDVYALGIVAYEMIAGLKPFNPTSVSQLSKMQEDGVRVKPSDLRPGVPEKAQQVLLKALEYNPHQRYVSARDFGDELANALLEEPGFPPIVDSKVPTKTQNTGQGKPSYSKSIAYGAIALLLLTVGTLAVVKFFKQKADTSESVSTAANNPPSASIPERSLNYSIQVQKYRNNRAYQKPFTIPGEINFEKDDRIQVFLTSPQQGYLYLINEGPPEQGIVTNPMILFPDKDKPALLPANQRVQIPSPSNSPEEDWIGFDAEQGTETLWIVWSAEAIPLFEATKKWSNPKDLGEIKDAAQTKDIRDFLAKNALSSHEVKRNEDGKHTMVIGKGDILIYSLKLQHH